MAGHQQATPLRDRPSSPREPITRSCSGPAGPQDVETLRTSRVSEVDDLSEPPETITGWPTLHSRAGVPPSHRAVQADGDEYGRSIDFEKAANTAG